MPHKQKLIVTILSHYLKHNPTNTYAKKSQGDGLTTLKNSFPYYPIQGTFLASWSQPSEPTAVTQGWLKSTDNPPVIYIYIYIYFRISISVPILSSIRISKKQLGIYSSKHNRLTWNVRVLAKKWPHFWNHMYYIFHSFIFFSFFLCKLLYVCSIDSCYFLEVKKLLANDKTA